MLEIRKYTKEAAPLIHCITQSHLNSRLRQYHSGCQVPARSWRSIRHEVAEITAEAAALMLNLGKHHRMPALHRCSVP